MRFIKNKRFILFFAVSLFVNVNTLFAQTFKTTYRISYQRDSTNINSKQQEIAFLFNSKEYSYYATENFLKKDSIFRLVNAGKVSAYEVMSDKSNLHHTKFDQFIQKDLQESVTVYEKINIDTYKYSINNGLLWDILDTAAIINGYDCTKATTHFAGRDYEVWFTKDIPISDGPYIFCGLPGLIVKINDVKSYYTFELIGFEYFAGDVVTTVAKDPEKIIYTNREEVFKIREESRNDPIGSFDRSSVFKSIMTPEMKQLAKKKVAANNNPLELSLD
jgi:GLPGLI family protein